MMIVQLIVPLAILATASLPNTPDPHGASATAACNVRIGRVGRILLVLQPLTLGPVSRQSLSAAPQDILAMSFSRLFRRAIPPPKFCAIWQNASPALSAPNNARFRLKCACEGQKAEITVVEFADFRCGHCKDAVPIIEAAYRKLGKSVKFIFVPFPPATTQSIAAARASMAAADQGAFWKYHDALFETQDKGFAKARLLSLQPNLG